MSKFKRRPRKVRRQLSTGERIEREALNRFRDRQLGYEIPSSVYQMRIDKAIF